MLSLSTENQLEQCLGTEKLPFHISVSVFLNGMGVSG
jgi:hypothetical protein